MLNGGRLLLNGGAAAGTETERQKEGREKERERQERKRDRKEREKEREREREPFIPTTSLPDVYSNCKENREASILTIYDSVFELYIAAV